jgi:diguanylate cyclase (GGDEF)-like protein
MGIRKRRLPFIINPQEENADGRYSQARMALEEAMIEKPLALIVEDDRDIAALFRHVLDIAGYRTEIVMDGRDAIERLKSVTPDIVLLDLSLPGIPGTKILEWMREGERFHGIPVVVVTAHSHIADSLAVEPDLVLLKPVNLGQLSNLLQRLRNTPIAVREPPWDPVTHLYNREFFLARLAYSLDRAQQIRVNRFGLLFVDLQPFAGLRDRLDPENLEIFLREIAGHLKSILRPTDTVSRFDEGLYLVLIEDIPEYSKPSSIAARVELDLSNFISRQELMDGLRANVGLLLCNANYGSVDEIMGDMQVARRLSGQPNARVNYERDMLRDLRSSSLPR